MDRYLISDKIRLLTFNIKVVDLYGYIILLQDRIVIKTVRVIKGV